MHFNSTPIVPSEDTTGQSPTSDFSIAPLGFLTETLLATEEHWQALPGVVPIFLREALDALLKVQP